MAQLQTRAFGAHMAASCAGCGTCRSTSLRRAQCRTLPAQLRAASIAPLRAPQPALASPKPRAMVVEAKRRKPTPSAPTSPPGKAESVAMQHYGGRQHHAHEKHAELMMRTFHLRDVDQLLRCDYGCVCGYRTWWRPMAIHLSESKECLAEVQSSGYGSAYDILDVEADSDDADGSEDEDDNGYADDSDAADDSEGADDSGDDDDDTADEALEMPEDFWRC